MLRRAQAAGEGAEGVAAAVLESGWTMGINFGPTVEDGDATLGEAVRALLKFQPVSRAISSNRPSVDEGVCAKQGIGRREKLIVKQR